jgi:outer membrane protein assembly factor BamD
MGVEILSTGTPSSTTAKPGDTNGGLTAVGPPNSTPLPAAEKATGTPDVVNDVQNHPQPAAQAANVNGKKKPNPAFDKSEESSSKHKKKKGLAKLNPF